MHPELVALCKDPIAWADELADRFKLMLKHVVDLSDSRSTFVTPPVKELMSMVVDTRAEGQASASDVLVAPPPAPHPAMAAIRDQEAPFALSQQSGASSSVVMCSVTATALTAKKSCHLLVARFGDQQSSKEGGVVCSP